MSKMNYIAHCSSASASVCVSDCANWWLCVCVCVCIFKCTTKYAAKYNKQLRGLVTFRIWMCFPTQHTLRQNTGSRTYTATNL